MRVTSKPEPAKPNEAEWVRRKRLEAVFGDVLPESTTDDQAAPEAVAKESASDAWLREQVPPHHG